MITQRYVNTPEEDYRDALYACHTLARLKNIDLYELREYEELKEARRSNDTITLSRMVSDINLACCRECA